MSQHSLAEALERLPDLIDRALAGEGIVITRDGMPAVELRPLPLPASFPAKDRHMTEAEWDRLASRRVGDRRRVAEDAGELVSRMRDEGER